MIKMWGCFSSTNIYPLARENENSRKVTLFLDSVNSSKLPEGTLKLQQDS
jgi:hypothetical protein